MFVIRPLDGEYFEVAKKEGRELKSEYKFKPCGRDLSEFAARCEFHQTSPLSHFTQGKVCSMMTLGGRKTLTDSKFIATANGERSETTVRSKAEFDEILYREFGISQATPQMRQDKLIHAF